MDWFLYDNNLRHERVKCIWEGVLLFWKFAAYVVYYAITDDSIYERNFTQTYFYC